MNEQVNLPQTSARQPARQRGVAPMFSRLRDEIEQIFDDFSLPVPQRDSFLPSMGLSAMGMHLRPAVDLEDRKDRYELAIDLPGMDEKDIDIEYGDGVLTISGEKKTQSEEHKGDLLVSERSYGSFRRRMTLPQDVDPDQIAAKYRKGVLNVTMKKSQQAIEHQRKIAIG